ncbi:MAG: hypothetical protein J2P21_15015 [Chloracidobacterium sp.]|nr:hypothetical protein [Chloracidobacterium sp.]
MKYRFLIILLIGLSLGTVGAGTGATDISGTWDCMVNLEGGPQNIKNTFVFKQQGEKLFGSQSGGLGEQQITGTVKGNKVVFGYEAKREGQTLKITYTGAIESPTKMTGALEFPKGPGKWTATKK